jgi:hypothetical protein
MRRAVILDTSKKGGNGEGNTAETGVFGNMVDMGISIHQVVRSALVNAASIASMVLEPNINSRIRKRESSPMGAGDGREGGMGGSTRAPFRQYPGKSRDPRQLSRSHYITAILLNVSAIILSIP